MNITTNEVKLKPIDDKFYEVLEDIHYIDGLVVPKGFITDLASIPVEFQDIIGKPDDLRYRDASILSSTNIKIKELMCISSTQDELVGFIKEHNEDEIEGVVVEDSSGYMFKHKFKFYKQWKKYRGIKHHIDKGDSISNRDKDLGFVKWYKENIATDKNIIEIRKNYLTTFKQ